MASLRQRVTSASHPERNKSTIRNDGLTWPKSVKSGGDDLHSSVWTNQTSATNAHPKVLFTSYSLPVDNRLLRNTPFAPLDPDCPADLPFGQYSSLWDFDLPSVYTPLPLNWHRWAQIGPTQTWTHQLGRNPHFAKGQHTSQEEVVL